MQAHWSAQRSPDRGIGCEQTLRSNHRWSWPIYPARPRGCGIWARSRSARTRCGAKGAELRQTATEQRPEPRIRMPHLPQQSCTCRAGRRQSGRSGRHDACGRFRTARGLRGQPTAMAVPLQQLRHGVHSGLQQRSKRHELPTLRSTTRTIYLGAASTFSSMRRSQSVPANLSIGAREVIGNGVSSSKVSSWSPRGDRTDCQLVRITA